MAAYSTGFSSGYESAFRASATSTAIVQLPVDFYLHEYPLYESIISMQQGQPSFKRMTTKTFKGGQLSGRSPGFKRSTSSRGY